MNPAVGIAATAVPVSIFAKPASAMLVLAALTLLPFAFVMLTSFMKIIVVLAILRTAIGTPQVPPGIVLTGLAIILSIYVMAPTGMETYEAAQKVWSDEKPLAERNAGELFAAAMGAREPIRQFLIRNSRRDDRLMYLNLAKKSWPASARVGLDDRHFIVAIPAFVVGQLTLAFKIGFFLFIPFVVVDLVVANSLLALGMHMLSPTTISLPFKLLLFVLVDGWRLLSQGLVLSYG
jgi:type III secretion protein R